MKKIICIILAMVMVFAFVTSAFADEYYHGTPEYHSTLCKKRFTTEDCITKSSNESWGDTYCLATVSFETANPSYNYLIAQPYCKSEGVSLGDPVHIINSTAYGYPLDFNGSEDYYNSLNIRITNPYYVANHSNTINMVSDGCFWAYWD